MLKEIKIPDDRIEILPDGCIQVREATVILRDGLRDASFPPKYHRYLLQPGTGLIGADPRLAAIAEAAWRAGAITESKTAANDAAPE